jgi:prepilin-type processing-associated H-X9-DG protein
MKASAGQLGRTDVAILVGATGLLLCNLAAVGTTGRERAREAVCLANLDQMTQAWLLYAADNDDKIVNGEAQYGGTPGTCTTPSLGLHENEKPWVGSDCHPGYMTNRNHPADVQIRAIRAGALFPYCGDERLYHCPDGVVGAIRTYSVTDAMNGCPRAETYTTALSRTAASNTSVTVGETVLWVKKTTEITAPGPAERLAFVDEGRVSLDSYSVHYVNAYWWDPPHVRHGQGTNVSYADGHAEHWTWEAAETIATGAAEFPLHQFQPTTAAGRRDLQRMQTAVWGRLGY